jgi:hypothetical protein
MPGMPLLAARTRPTAIAVHDDPVRSP